MILYCNVVNFETKTNSKKYYIYYYFPRLVSTHLLERSMKQDKCYWFIILTMFIYDEIL